jgi:hypothetical protein
MLVREHDRRRIRGMQIVVRAAAVEPTDLQAILLQESLGTVPALVRIYLI